MPFIDESDPNIAPTEFEEFPQGEHGVAGIFEFISVDDQGVPLYKERDNHPYTLVRLRLTDGTAGPPMGCSPADLVLLVKAFAGDAAIKMLPEDRSSVQFLLRVKQVANCEAPDQAGKTPIKQTAYVNKGFVRNVTGAYLPTDQLFQFGLDSITNLDYSKDGLAFKELQQYHQEVVRASLRVMGDMTGAKTMYDGATTPILIANPFDGSREITTDDGRTALMPKFKVNPNRSQPRDVARIRQFINIFCPEIMKYEWVSDMTRSKFGTNEVENPIVVIADAALGSGRRAIGKLSMPTKKGAKPIPRLDLLDMVAADGSAPAAPNMAQNSKSNLLSLFDTINDFVQDAYGTGAFLPNTRTLSESGTTWAKTKMTPVWDKLGLPQPRRLAELTEDQASKLMGELLSTYGWPKSKTTPAPSLANDF